MKGREIIIVENNPDLRYIYSSFARGLGFEPFGFELPAYAFSHLVTSTKKPHACFVDINPYNSIPENYSSRKLPELIFSDRIANLIKKRGWQEGFYFTTSDYSGFAQKIIESSNSNFLLKGDADSCLDWSCVKGYSGIISPNTFLDFVGSLRER